MRRALRAHLQRVPRYHQGAVVLSPERVELQVGFPSRCHLRRQKTCSEIHTDQKHTGMTQRRRILTVSRTVSHENGSSFHATCSRRRRDHCARLTAQPGVKSERRTTNKRMVTMFRVMQTTKKLQDG